MRHLNFIVLAAAVSLASISPAAAQDQQTTTAPINQGPMTVERITGGFLVAPDFKVTRFDHHTSELAGAYAGWLSDRTFFVGGGAYFLTNGNRDRELAYGGLVIGWMALGDRPVGFGVKTLIGGGQATLVEPAQILVFPVDDRGPRATAPPQPAQPTLTSVNVRVRNGCFVAEPEVNVVVHIARNVRLTGGIGYRLIGNDRHFDVTNPNTLLRGPTAGISLQIGGS